MGEARGGENPGRNSTCKAEKYGFHPVLMLQRSVRKNDGTVLSQTPFVDPTTATASLPGQRPCPSDIELREGFGRPTQQGVRSF